MEIRFNVKGAERKALVTAMGEITGREPVYQGAPTFAYAVDSLLIDKEGTLSGDVNAALLDTLALRGFVGEHFVPDDASPEESPDSVTIELPKEGFTAVSLTNLRKLVASKAALIKKAFGVDELPIEETETTLRFPWISAEVPAESMDAYIHFITALCKMAKEQKRITARARPIENEKYAMRCLMLRLGFIGAESKAARKILLANLSGNSSFKNGRCNLVSEEKTPITETQNSDNSPYDLADIIAEARL